MIECKFCLSLKSKQYLYTICEHLICINCAALRINDGLKCCNRITQLSKEIQQQLIMKKNIILDNLNKEYQYNHNNNNNNNDDNYEDDNVEENNTQRDDMEIEEEMQKNDGKYNNYYDGNKHEQQYLQQQINNNNNLHEQFYQTSPIKKISQLLNTSHQNSPSKTKKQQQIQIISTNNNFTKSNFTLILNNKTQQINQLFKSIHNQLYKKQQNLINQVNVYYEEYMKLLEKEDYSNLYRNYSKIDIQSFKGGLQDYMNKWDIQNLCQIVKYYDKENKYHNDIDQEKQNKEYKQKVNKNYFSIQQRYMNNQKQSIFNNKIDTFTLKQGSLTKNNYQSYTNRQASYNKNSACNLSTHKTVNLASKNPNQPYQSTIPNYLSQQTNITSRNNLDKIYKKLQQSRTKLQDRINKHNWFMTDRCKNVNVNANVNFNGNMNRNIQRA